MTDDTSLESRYFNFFILMKTKNNLVFGTNGAYTCTLKHCLTIHLTIKKNLYL